MTEDNIQIYRHTIQIFQQGGYTLEGIPVPCKLSAQKRSQARVYLPEDIHQILQTKDCKPGMPNHCAVYNRDCISVTLDRLKANRADSDRLRRTLVLNLANPFFPGGSVIQGGKAQEEDLCRKSSLMFSLTGQQAAGFYSFHHTLQSPLASDSVILSPRVEIIKDEHGTLLPQTEVISVISCAAPDLRQGLSGISRSQYEQLLYNRILGILKCAALWGFESLVLGAFGCGVFRNDPQTVAMMFHKALAQCGHSFYSVEFAVLDKTKDQKNFKAFFHRLNF